MTGDVKNDFIELIRGVRSGSDESATRLLNVYGPQIRRLARVRLSDPNLRRVIDSQDICQSVMANFFQRATAGQFELETPDALLRLLATMIRNRITDKARHFQAARQDLRRNSASDSALRGVADSVCTPSLIVGRQEILQQVRSLLTEEEHRLVELRNQGCGWAEIAEQLNASPEQLRKRLARALERIAGEPNADEDSDDES